MHAPHDRAGLPVLAAVVQDIDFVALQGGHQAGIVLGPCRYGLKESFVDTPRIQQNLGRRSQVV